MNGPVVDDPQHQQLTLRSATDRTHPAIFTMIHITSTSHSAGGLFTLTGLYPAQLHRLVEGLADHPPMPPPRPQLRPRHHRSHHPDNLKTDPQLNELRDIS
ncbi:hypothetical protein [Actinomadura sp. 6N118]|uniref:hypothetical protein n=1 Tax=Actinomadura sp. 6N118 TaxID=3375151 RepID=UPI00378E572B